MTNFVILYLSFSALSEQPSALVVEAEDTQSAIDQIAEPGRVIVWLAIGEDPDPVREAYDNRRVEPVPDLAQAEDGIVTNMADYYAALLHNCPDVVQTQVLDLYTIYREEQERRESAPEPEPAADPE